MLLFCNQEVSGSSSVFLLTNKMGNRKRLELLSAQSYQDHNSAGQGGLKSSKICIKVGQHGIASICALLLSPTARAKVAAVTLGGVSLQHPDARCSPRWWRRGVGAQNVLCVLHQAANRPHHCCCALLSALLELGAGRRGVSTRK